MTDSEKLDKILESLKGIERAFPANEYGEPDYEGHRRDHRSRMDKAERDEESRRKSVDVIRNRGILAGLTLGAVALWEYVKDHLR